MTTQKVPLPTTHSGKHFSAEIILATIHLPCTSTLPCFIYAWCMNRCPLMLMNNRVFSSMKQIHDPGVRFTEEVSVAAETAATCDTNQEQEMAVRVWVEMLVFGCDFVTLTCATKRNQSLAEMCKVSSISAESSVKEEAQKKKQKKTTTKKKTEERQSRILADTSCELKK